MSEIKEKDIAYKAEKALRDAMVYASQITTEIKTKNITNILNANTFLAKFHAYMDILWEIDFDEYINIGKKTRSDRDYILLAIERAYDFTI